MRYEHLLLFLVLSIGYSLPQSRAEKGVILVARTASTTTHKSTSTSKPTVAPLRTSTPLPSVVEVKPAAVPTKAPAVVAIEPSRYSESSVTQETVPEPLPLETPPTNASLTQQEAIPRQATPLKVTGFITKDGNIYEVTDKNGIGTIEGRQSPENDMSSHVCNYGSVVIYSDVPCDEVTNVRIGEVHHQVVNTANREQYPEESQQSWDVGQQVSADNTNNDYNFDAFDDIKPQPTKKRRRVNKNSTNKRRRNGYNDRPMAVRQGGGNRRRQQTQEQQRRGLQNNKAKQQRRRLQQQQEEEEYRRRNQNAYRNGQRKRDQSYNRRRYSGYDDDDY